ncbi:MAG: hypothetical protein AAFQ65_04510 [Myxococcota bacterium]
MQKTLIVLLFFTSAACSTSRSTTLTKRSMIASMKPMAPDTKRVEIAEEDNSASAHLERAFYHFRLSHYRAAASSFQEAIKTNNLNDSGRALAYWHIYLCRAHLNDEDGGADALMSFSVVAEDMLNPDDRFGREYSASREFVERFDMDARLARARAILAALWVDRSADYGRSGLQPIRVRSDQELSMFLEIAPPCNNADERQVDRRVLETDGENSIEEITLYCEAQLSGERFVIEHRSE